MLEHRWTCHSSNPPLLEICTQCNACNIFMSLPFPKPRRIIWWSWGNCIVGYHMVCRRYPPLQRFWHWSFQILAMEWLWLQAHSICPWVMHSLICFCDLSLVLHTILRTWKLGGYPGLVAHGNVTTALGVSQLPKAYNTTKVPPSIAIGTQHLWAPKPL